MRKPRQTQTWTGWARIHRCRDLTSVFTDIDTQLKRPSSRSRKGNSGTCLSDRGIHDVAEVHPPGGPASGDGKVNVLDVQIVINSVLYGTCTPI